MEKNIPWDSAQIIHQHVVTSEQKWLKTSDASEVLFNKQTQSIKCHKKRQKIPLNWA